MMRSRWSKWLSGVGGALLVGGLVLANYGGGVTPAEAHHDYRHGYQNPFKQILSKLNLILEKLNAGGGGAPLPSTGGGAGNQSLRWDTNNQSALRFTVLTDFGGAAVRDNNTGLVWEQSPEAATTPATRNWSAAALYCVNKSVGGTKGWRLPSIPELASLIDLSTVTPGFLGPTLTQGHPFSNVTGANYWSATTSAHSNPTTTQFTINNSLVVNFQEGSVETMGKSSTAQAWCVRGPMSESVY
jgi:hypothetical protein